MNRIIIAGSRYPKRDSGITPITYEVVDYVMRQMSGNGGLLSVFGDIKMIVSGCATGVDTLGIQWAVENGKEYKRFPANWNANPKAAGPIRNRKMAEFADAAVVIVNTKQSRKGSDDMISQMSHARKSVIVAEVDMDSFAPEFTVTIDAFLPKSA